MTDTAPVLVGGLLSGTSVDGIDALLLEVGGHRDAEGLPTTWRVVGYMSPAWPEPLRDEILTVLRAGTASLATLTRLHGAIGEAMAEAFGALLAATGTSAQDVTAVGSHGQTFWHIPPTPAVGRGYTLQLGCPATLAERLGISVVSDFRTRDMAAGGEGAPLVPWPDRVFFHRPGVGRALQNLGGMGNVTYLPASGALAEVQAFDTGPGVALLDAAAAEATGGQLACDLDGALARKGRVDGQLLEVLLEDPFFRTPPPRSTGRETFGHAFLARIRGAHPTQRWEDLLATLTALTAVAAARSYRDFLPKGAVEEVVLTGGGARNPALVEAFERALVSEGVASDSARLPRVRTGAEALGMDPDAREAAAFALLAWAHVARVPSSLPQVTGARAPRVLGSWTPAH
jgi:anhydro-N-acetylmuramic acid kinase